MPLATVARPPPSLWQSSGRYAGLLREPPSAIRDSPYDWGTGRSNRVRAAGMAPTVTQPSTGPEARQKRFILKRFWQGTAPGRTPVPDGKLAAAVAASLQGQEVPDVTAPVAENAEETSEPTTGSPGTQAEAVVEEEAVTEPEAPAEASAEGTEEVPLSLLDVDLSALSAEDRANVIKAVEEQNKLIGKLMREKATEEGTTPTPEPAQAEAPEPVTDESLITALGLDMEDPYDANTAKVAVPLARMILDLKEQVAGVTSQSEATQAERYWNASLDKLESDNGTLPVERAQFFEYAADNDINDPELAYWRVMGPARSTLIKEVNAKKAAQTREKKQQATGVRPRTTTPTERVGLKAKTVKSATVEAAELAAKQLGLNWKDAWDSK